MADFEELIIKARVDMAFGRTYVLGPVERPVTDRHCCNFCNEGQCALIRLSAIMFRDHLAYRCRCGCYGIPKTWSYVQA